MSNFTIIIDTRETIPWDFSFYERCSGIVNRKLDTGDYSIEGLEHLVTIERKRTTAEIANNIGADGKRFRAELERMTKFKYKYILCEFSMEMVLSFPKFSTIPPGRWGKLRIGGKFIAKNLLSYKEEYGIDVIFCGNTDKANEKAAEILTYVYEAEMVRRPPQE